MLKTILSQVREYKKYALLSPLFVTFEVLFDILIPYFMSVIVDKGINLGDEDLIVRMGIFLVISVLLLFISGIASGYFATKASAGLAKNLRDSMFKNIQGFSFEDIDSFSKGSLLTRMTTDVQSVQLSFQMSTRIAIRSPLLLIFAFFMSFKINSKLAMYFLIMIPIMTFVLILVIKKVYPYFKKVFQLLDKLNTHVSENLIGIREVKAFTREDQQISKFNEISKDLYHKYIYIQKNFMMLMPFMNLCVYSISLLIAWLGAKFIILGSMKTGQLISLITYSFQIQISLVIFAMVFTQIVNSRNAAERISQIINKDSSLKNGKKNINVVKDGSISFEDVCFSYTDDLNKLALKNINLNIKAGANVGIIGSTGSSKSTLVQLIPRLYDVTKGCVKVGGLDVRDYNLKALRDSVATVLQKNQLFSGSIRSNLKFADENLSDEKMIEILKVAGAYDFVKEAGGLDAKVERGGNNFSGGQKQRLTIARALLKDPKILILDDSTSALDNTTERKIVENLNKYLPNLTRLTISQRINSLKYADTIVVMDEGEIESIGDHEYLLKNSKIYREISQSQEREGDFDEKK